MNAILPGLFDLSTATPVAQSRPLIVDSFAGGGGASTGIELALGRSPDIAINHSAAALAVHALNHPDTLHLSENIYRVDPLDAVGNRPVGLLWASPDCKHFSKAKGGAPLKRNVRDLAWVVVSWAKRARPNVIILENVEEFQTWGPLVEASPGVYKPCAVREGETFGRWVADLRRLGYRVEWRELVAADYGAPTSRRRLFVIARRDGLPIAWPTPTHGPGRAQAHRTVADFLDFSLPCPSISATSDEIMQRFGIRARRPLSDATVRRIGEAIEKFVRRNPAPFVRETPAGERFPFLLSFYGQGIGQVVTEPMRTILTKEKFGLVEVQFAQDGSLADVGLRMLAVAELFAAQGFPDGYRSDALVDGRPIPRSAQVSCAGNSVCPPLARALVAANCPQLIEIPILEAA